MITKLTALFLSGIMTVGLIAAASPAVTPAPEKEVNLLPMINACRQGYAEYESGKVDGPTSFANAINKFEGVEYEVAYLICIGYGTGRHDEKRMNHA